MNFRPRLVDRSQVFWRPDSSLRRQFEPAGQRLFFGPSHLEKILGQARRNRSFWASRMLSSPRRLGLVRDGFFFDEGNHMTSRKIAAIIRARIAGEPLEGVAARLNVPMADVSKIAAAADDRLASIAAAKEKLGKAAELLELERLQASARSIAAVKGGPKTWQR